jgi:hypothetical protein
MVPGQFAGIGGQGVVCDAVEFAGGRAVKGTYARGVAHAWRGEHAAAQAEADAMRKLAQGSDFSALVDNGVPAPDVIELARHVVLAARPVRNRGRRVRAGGAEDTLAYTEPPYWYYPVRQSLGAVGRGEGRGGRSIPPPAAPNGSRLAALAAWP